MRANYWTVNDGGVNINSNDRTVHTIAAVKIKEKETYA